MPLSIGTKLGTTYYSECQQMASIVNPIIDNGINMRYTGFFCKSWDAYKNNFDAIGYGLKKTRANKGLILCNDASKCFGTNKGYVGMVLSFPYDIKNGVYEPLINDCKSINEYLLFGVNVGQIDASYPSISAKMTSKGIEFAVWSIYGKFTIIDNVSNIKANSNNLYEFIWSALKIDDFHLNDFNTSMVIRINNEDISIGNAPIGDMDLSKLNFCVLDTPLNYYNLECTIGKLVLGNEIPEYIENEWLSSSSSEDILISGYLSDYFPAIWIYDESEEGEYYYEDPIKIYNTTGSMADLILVNETTFDDCLVINGYVQCDPSVTPKALTLPAGTVLATNVSSGGYVEVNIKDKWGVKIGMAENTGKLEWQTI